MDSLYKQLKDFGQTKLNTPLAKYTTFKIGGAAHYFLEVDDTDKLVKTLDFLSGEGVPYFVLGGGSNLLFSDQEYDGVVVKIATRKNIISENSIRIDAGLPLALLVNTCNQYGFTGAEWAAGIPGTIGGAVRGNAGAYGGATADNLVSVTVWRDRDVIKLSPVECGFGYRESIFKHNTDVVLSAEFTFATGDKAAILQKSQGYILERSAKFPRFFSAGSFFKNFDLKNYHGDKSSLPEKFLQVGKVGAAWFIEQAGMKGCAVGDAKVSDEHANFIVNCNNATQADVLTLVEQVREAVYNKFGVELEPEVQIVKN